MALNIDGTTGISGVDGSVSAPALTGTDSNTGITFPSADTIKFSTGGVERLAISNSGLSGDGSGLTGIAAGITMADQWRRTANVALNNSINYLTTDWERVDGSGQGTLTGSGGMTESGGIFTFPSTGIYKVEWQGYFEDTGSSATITTQIHVTTDNNNYNRRAHAINHISNISSYTYGFVATQTFVDVTDTSNVKVKFAVSSEGSTALDSSSSENRNCATFIRLGDT